MRLKITTPIPSLHYSITKKLKTGPTHVRGYSQTPTLKKKISPSLSKSFNCYQENHSLSTHSRNSPSILKEKILTRKTKNRIKVIQSLPSLLSQAKTEIANKNFMNALELLSKVVEQEVGFEVRYYRGVCFMHLKLFAEALKELKTVQEGAPGYDPQLYVALYMCWMSQNEYSSAFKALTACIRIFPKYSKAYLLRGQMLNKMKKYEKAFKDFQKTKTEESCFYVAQSFKGVHQYQRALEFLQQAEKIEHFRIAALIEKAKILYKLSMFQESKSLLESLANENNYQVHYYLSKIKIKDNDLAQAGLLLEQVTQHTSDQSLSFRAICKIALIKIKEKDYYGALHTFHRANGNLHSKNKKSLFLFTEAVVALMKRKYSEGIQLLTGLIKDNSLKDFILNCFVFRAYGLYASGKYAECIEDYTLVSYSQTLDKASEFNFNISKGIVAAKHWKLVEILQYFKELEGQFSKNPVAEMCQVCVLLQYSTSDVEVLKNAEKIIQSAGRRRTDSEILYVKAIISYFQCNFDQAHDYIKECIEKAEENLFAHYVVRGFCNLALKVYSEAVQDFSAALQLNESLKVLYPYRGLCAYLSDDYCLAVDDFLTYSDAGDLETVILSAKLLLFAACYTDALILLSKVKETEEVLLCKAYCYLMTDLPNKAIWTLNKLGEDKVQNDIRYIEKFTLGEAEYCGEGQIFTQKYALWIKGVMLMYREQFSEAIDTFQAALEIMHADEGQIFNDNVITEEESCEILYNIALCNILSQQEVNLTQPHTSHALLILKELSEIVNSDHRGQLFLICAIFELAHKNKESAESLLKESAKHSPDHCRRFLEGESLEILPLHTGNEFSKRFSLIAYYGNRKVKLRPAIPLPKILPGVGFEDSCAVMQGLFRFETLLPRPEAPWLNRNKGSIQFTDLIIDLELEDSKRCLKQVERKVCKSQEVRKKSELFLKVEKSDKENSRINGLIKKIKEICS